MDTAFLVPVILFLLCLTIRCAYELLKEKGRINPESKPVFAVVLTAMLVLWFSWFALCAADPFRVEYAGGIRWAGFAVVILGTIVAVGALIQLRGVENIDHLVTRGLFAKFRHPMYMGFVAWFLGWSIYNGAMVSLAIGIPGIACVLWWRKLEEARLEKQFGDAYVQYRRTTWY